MRKRFYNLKKTKIRQSWNKYNLYQLSRLLSQTYRPNYFQQKWAAKSMTRNYHGEQVREGQWEVMFDPRLRSVVPMNPAYLARTDGSQEAAGRGSGLEFDRAPGWGQQKHLRIPYMNMVYAPLERRLDVAIHRALFASSTRQARQFVVHGSVKVNGKKMIYPGYLLNPGDMFQVEPERVMYGTGAPKEGIQSRSGRVTRRKQMKAKSEGDREETSPTDGETVAEEDALPAEEKPTPDKASPADVESLAEEDTLAAAESSESPKPKSKIECEAGKSNEKELSKEEIQKEDEANKKTLKTILGQAKNILSTSKEDLPAKRKQDLRAFQREVRKVLARSSSRTIMTDSLEAQFLEMKNQLAIQERDDKKEAKSEGKASKPQDLTRPQDTPRRKPEPIPKDESEVFDASALSTSELLQLKTALAELRDNPIDTTKPYATPWRPRDYMSPFVFIPRFLEVHPTICAAVYLRHPVARPGSAEVPTPFKEATNGLAFNWYLRRR